LGAQGSELRYPSLGISGSNWELFSGIIKNPNGIVLVSGPTGSGKTTTLYTVLSELNKPELNIVTVEDPVEFRMAGINQVQINQKAGLTFASGLRSILRQDPDIIMIGEIRDSETAEIAVRAAITGHLVLSTIHTNDAASTVHRLIDMGVEPFLVSASLVGVVAQRLVRRLCPRCKQPYRPEHNEMMLLRLTSPTELYKPAGCPYCNNTGYKGRMAVHEIIAVNKEIRELIDRRANIDQLHQCAQRFGTISLRDSCTELVLKGETSTDQLVKIAYGIN
ncbi:MAG: GspE/PulE family protein, partial [Clostridia bacterium]|nr:GspE/PulE family protein [Clostridia bacterium]